MVDGLDPASILLTSASLLVPGLGITLALQPPGSASLPVRIALAFAFGYATIALTSLALALGNVLTPAPLLVTVGAVSVLAWVFAIRRGKAHLQAIRDDVRRAWSRYVTLVLVLAGAVAARLTFVTPLTNFSQTVARYWADGLEIADAHGIPAHTLQWGQLLLPTKSKIALNTFNATMSLLLGRGPLVPAGALLFVLSIAIVFGAYGLAEEFGLRLLAPILPVLLFFNGLVGNTHLTVDLRQNHAENWGRFTVLAALILAVRALKPREDPGGPGNAEHSPLGSRREAVLAGVLFGVTAGTHLVPTVVGLTLAGSYALMQMVVGGGVARTLRTSALALAAASVVGGVILILPRGDLGFQGASGDAAYAAIRTELGLPSTFDPTLYLVFGNVDKASAGFPYSPNDVLLDFSRQVLGHNAPEASAKLSTAAAVLPSLLAALGVGLLLVFGDRDLRAMAGASALFALLLVAVAALFAARYHLFALETFGNRRLFDYVLIPFALVAIGLGELLLRRLGRAAEVPGRRRWVKPAAAGVLSVAIAAALMPSSRMGSRGNGAAADLALVTWVGQHTPCEGRILADRRTLGTFEALDGRAAVLEGMGPHVRPDVLLIALSQMFRAEEFFADPSAGRAYLQENGVAYVVTTRPGHMIFGWWHVYPSQTMVTITAPFLKNVFQNDAGTVYEVVGFQPDPRLPDPADQPGYCKS